MTIEERASNVVRKAFHKEFWNDKVDADMRQIKNLMVEFATEQHESDIQRIVEWLSSHLCFLEIDRDLFIESFKQAMKGDTE